ncbi:MAG: hypothetical protein ACRC2T_20660, partial [Thermoguttaceae bacterium]
ISSKHAKKLLVARSQHSDIVDATENDINNVDDKKTYKQSLYCFESLIAYYLRTKQYDTASKVFAEMLTDIDERESNLLDSRLPFMCKDIATFLVREGNVEEGLGYLDKMPVSMSPDYVTQNFYYELASMLAKTGNKAGSQKIMSCAKNFPEWNVGAVRYYSARYVYLHDTPEKALKVLRQLLVKTMDGNYFGLPREMKDKNDLGMMFYVLGDTENAKILFDMVDTELLRIRNDQSRFIFSTQANPTSESRLLAERFKMGMKKESVEFILSNASPELLADRLYYFIFQTADILSEQEKVELLDQLHVAVLKFDKNPGITLDRQPKIPFLNVALKFYAMAALLLDNLNAAKETIKQYEKLEAELPPMQRRQTLKDPLYPDDNAWINCYDNIMQRKMYPQQNEAGIICADHIERVVKRYEMYKNIVVRILQSN